MTTITKNGYVDTADGSAIKPFQGGTFPGELVITASRSSGVSPCTIIFTAKNTTRVGYDEHQVIGTGGTSNVAYRWDFGDDNGDTYNTHYQGDKNTITGAFMAAHTFEVADGGGTVAFIVSCRCKDASGNEAWAQTVVTVQAQDTAYSAANTIAISNTLVAGSWDSNGETRNPPSGYTEYSTIAAAGSTSGGNVWWDDIAGKRIMLYRGDDFSSEGPVYIRSGNHDFTVTWFGDELSGTTVSASTISFTAPTATNKNNGIGGTISDSGSGLGSLTVGAEIDITGSTSNNGTFTVQSVAAGSVNIRYDKGHVLTTEAAGDSVVITEHNLYPELNIVYVGNKDAADTSMFMDDADLEKAATAFSNDGWIEDAYIEGVRTPNITTGVAWRHITLHKIDNDWSQEGVVNMDAGRLKLGEWVFPLQNGDISASNCLYPYGMYISECTSVGSASEISTNDDPTTNIQLGGFGGAWCCYLGSRCRQASEMNLRIEGYQHFLIQDSDFLGQHIGGSGGKGRIVQRGLGINRIPEITSDRVRGDDHAFDADRKFWPYSRWGVAQRFFDSSANTGQSTYTEIGTPGTLETTFWSLHEDVLWNDFTIDPDATVYTADSIQVEVVRYLCITNHQDFNGNPIDDNSSSPVDDGPDNVVTEGVETTQAGYLGPTYLDGALGTTYNLPTPSAPR